MQVSARSSPAVASQDGAAHEENDQLARARRSTTKHGTLDKPTTATDRQTRVHTVRQKICCHPSFPGASSSHPTPFAFAARAMENFVKKTSSTRCFFSFFFLPSSSVLYKHW